jgi:hypothetical protein
VEVDLRFFVVGTAVEKKDVRGRLCLQQATSDTCTWRKGEGGGGGWPDVPGGINTLSVDAGMAFKCTLPPRVHVLLEMQHLEQMGSGSQRRSRRR